jgi:hypothetical protein
MADLRNIVKDCNTLNEIIKEVNKSYDLDKKLGLVSGQMVKSYIAKVIEICQIEKR